MVRTMEEDFSKKTVVVLVLLTVILSLVGTFTTLKAISDVGPAQIDEETNVNTATGQVKLTVANPPYDQATGKITLNKIQ